MKQHLVQEQKLQRKMTQNLLQSIQLLQYSGVELIDYIKEIAKENPLIEEVNYDDDINQFRMRGSSDVSIGDINQTVLSMYDRLKGQIYSLGAPEAIQPLIKFGIDSLNKEGYLDITLEEWASLCNTTIEKVKEALFFIQSLDPPGIGARDLSECIFLQLKEKTSVPFLKSLVTNHIDWIAEQDIASISAHYNIIEAQATKIIEMVEACEPYPGLSLEDKQPEYILPEAAIRRKDDEWSISFYAWNRPTITVDESYKQLLDIEEDATAFLKEKYKQIDWLNQAIAYRTNTLELIIKILIVKQRLFFEHGAHMLRPLTLREVAHELHISISTVSRAIRDKYVQTPYGIISLKFFFQSGIKQNGKQKISKQAVKQLIVDIIEQEDHEQPLSDEAIKCQLNQAFNLQIARRTVRKYRAELNIPPSTKRY